MGIYAIATLVIASTVEQRKRAKKVRKAQEKAARVESAERAQQARRSRRVQIREARIKQAQIENVAASSGQQSSSAAIAAGSSLQARLGTNIGSIQEALAISDLKSQSEQDILDANKVSDLELGSRTALDLYGAR